MSTFCRYFDQHECRSCSLIEQDYPLQIAAKEKVLTDSLRDVLHQHPEHWIESSVLSPPMGFRNKAKMSVTGTTEEPIIGILRETNLDLGQELLECPIHHPHLNQLMAILPGFIRDYALVPYQISKKTGELKGLIAFYSPQSDQMYLRFVLRSRECVSRIKKLLPLLQSKIPSLTCVSANIQPIPHAVLEGPDEIILSEKDFIEHILGTIPMRLTPQAFVQTNVQVATQLYQTAARWIAEVHPCKVLELYCGQGAFSFFAQRCADQFLGIELNPEAVAIANQTAASLGLKHLSFKSSDATQIKDEIDLFRPKLILANPPRKGLGKSLEWILLYRPDYLIYSSCNIKTLALDLKALSTYYEVKRVQLFDMFPHTEHFETLVWLNLKQ